MAFYFIIFLFVVLSAVRIRSNVQNKRPWHEGFFEPEHSEESYSNDPLLEAYISLGALMVRLDTASYGKKVLFLNSYFSKNFPKTHYHFGRSFTESLKNPVRPEVTTKWLRRKLPHQKERLQIMYFLAGIATVDGSMNTREIELLKEMNGLLEFSSEDFDKLIALYTRKYERAQSNENSISRASALQLAYKTIGVPEGATILQIKKAYRKLVMLHHPDRFATSTLVQQETAEQRFLEIQKAYEILESTFVR